MRSPNFPCGYCGVTDWANEDGRWVCMQCRVIGRPTPPTPNYSNVFDFDTWKESTYKDYDRLLEERDKEETSASSESPVAAIVRAARLRKLDEDIKNIATLSEVATLIEYVKGEHARGDVYIDIPGIVGDDGYGFKIRVTWP